MTVLYLIGPPGVGKSTALATATGAWGDLQPHQHPFAHGSAPEGILLGRPDPTFPGTDTLSMSVLPKVLAWLTTQSPDRLIVGEGDRLSTKKFFQGAHRAGHTVRVAALYAPWTTVQARALARGGTQDMAWVRGRWTKHLHLMETWPVRMINANQRPGEVARLVSDWLNE